MSVLPVCISVYCMHAWGLEVSSGRGFPRTGAMDVCELPYGCREPNLSAV